MALVVPTSLMALPFLTREHVWILDGTSNSNFGFGILNIWIGLNPTQISTQSLIEARELFHTMMASIIGVHFVPLNELLQYERRWLLSDVYQRYDWIPTILREHRDGRLFNGTVPYVQPANTNDRPVRWLDYALRNEEALASTYPPMTNCEDLPFSTDVGIGASNHAVRTGAQSTQESEQLEAFLNATKSDETTVTTARVPHLLRTTEPVPKHAISSGVEQETGGASHDSHNLPSMSSLSANPRVTSRVTPQSRRSSVPTSSKAISSKATTTKGSTTNKESTPSNEGRGYKVHFRNERFYRKPLKRAPGVGEWGCRGCSIPKAIAEFAPYVNDPLKKPYQKTCFECRGRSYARKAPRLIPGSQAAEDYLRNNLHMRNRPPWWETTPNPSILGMLVGPSNAPTPNENGGLVASHTNTSNTATEATPSETQDMTDGAGASTHNPQIEINDRPSEIENKIDEGQKTSGDELSISSDELAENDNSQPEENGAIAHGSKHQPRNNVKRRLAADEDDGSVKEAMRKDEA